MCETGKRLWGTSGRRDCFSSNYYFGSIWCLNQSCQVIRKRSALQQYCCESLLICLHGSLGKYLERKTPFQDQESLTTFHFLGCVKNSPEFIGSVTHSDCTATKRNSQNYFLKCYITKGGQISVGSGKSKKSYIGKIQVLNRI